MPGSVLVDMFTDEEMGEVDDLHSFAVTLGPHEGRSLLVLCPGDHPVALPASRPISSSEVRNFVTHAKVRFLF